MGDAGRRADQGNTEGENLVRGLRQIIEQRRGPKFFGASFFWRTELEPARRLNQSQLVGIATSHNTRPTTTAAVPRVDRISGVL